MKPTEIWKILMVISFSAFGCGKCPKSALSLSEKNWINHFKKGQTFYFKNAGSQTDTLEISEVRNFYTACNKMELSEYQFEVYDVSFIIKSTSDYNNNESLISYETSTYKSRVPHIYFGNLVPYAKESDNKMPVEMDTNLNGTTLKSVYFYANGLNMVQHGNLEYFKNFFWSKELGLVAYTTSRGSVFVKSSQ